MVKHLPASVGQIRDVGWIPGSGRFPGEGHGTPVLLPGESRGQRSPAGYIHGVAENQTRVKRFSTHAQI